MPLRSYGRASAWHAERNPDWIAVCHDGDKVTFGALERRASGALAQPALVIRGPVGEEYAFPAVPSGFEPEPGLSDAALREARLAKQARS